MTLKEAGSFKWFTPSYTIITKSRIKYQIFSKDWNIIFCLLIPILSVGVLWEFWYIFSVWNLWQCSQNKQLEFFWFDLRSCFQNYWSHTLSPSTSTLLGNCWCHAIFSAKAAVHLFINNAFLVRLQLNSSLTFFSCFFSFPSDT